MRKIVYRMSLFALTLGCFILGGCLYQRPDMVVFVDSDLAPVVDSLLKTSELHTGNNIFVEAKTGDLLAQKIKFGARCDLFLSLDSAAVARYGLQNTFEAGLPLAKDQLILARLPETKPQNLCPLLMPSQGWPSSFYASELLAQINIDSACLRVALHPDQLIDLLKTRSVAAAVMPQSVAQRNGLAIDSVGVALQPSLWVKKGMAEHSLVKKFNAAITKK